MSKVALIIPAYNEERRIEFVLEAAGQSKLIDEIIVVNDGSSDGTAESVRKVSGVKLIDLPVNVGKGGAMTAGVRATDAPVIAFLDADLVGLRPDHIDSIVQPVLEGRCQMSVGVFRGGKFWSNTGQIIFPYISGQRAMTRALFNRIPNLRDKGYGVEIAIYDYLKRRKDVSQERVVLRGVSNAYKESKLGFVKGFRARQKMYSEMYRVRMRNLKLARAEKKQAEKKQSEQEAENKPLRLKWGRYASRRRRNRY